METREFARPRVVVSRCLGFEACRYNGKILNNAFLGKLAPHVRFVTVCPEVAIGLGTPRDPIHIVRDEEGDRLVQPSTGRDLTGPMQEFSREFLAGVGEVDGFILKARSPSCAIADTTIHSPQEQDASLGKGPGLFARAVLEQFPDVAVEDEERLTDRRIREHFLARIFTLAAFRERKRRPTMRGLMNFHQEHKLLFTALNRTRCRLLHQIVANQLGLPVKQVYGAYERELVAIFARLAAADPGSRSDFQPFPEELV